MIFLSVRRAPDVKAVRGKECARGLKDLLTVE